MYRQLIEHREYIKSKLGEDLPKEERQRLYDYHIDRVRDFQHERLIHLLVTFFFGILLLVSLAALLAPQLAELQLPLLILTALLFALELAYIRHYYQLENGVQSLYALTKRLYQDR